MDISETPKGIFRHSNCFEKSYIQLAGKYCQTKLTALDTSPPSDVRLSSLINKSYHTGISIRILQHGIGRWPVAKDGTYPWKASADREATGFNRLSRFCTILRRCFVTPGCVLFGFAAIYECRRGPGTNLTLRSAIMGFLYTFFCRIITWLTFPLRCAYHILCSLISYNTFIEGYRGQRDQS